MLAPGPALVLWALAAAGGDTPWVALPAGPTVGDTVWLTRVIAVAPEWRVRAAAFESQGDVAPLGEPVVTPGAGEDTIRYAVVAWTAGPHRLVLPTLWVVKAEGRSDSLAGGTVDLTVRSVLPADTAGLKPKALLPPVDLRPPSFWPPALAVLLAAVALVLTVRLRRRGPRPTAAAAELVLGGPAPDDRWLDAGEPKAVAARASRILREALARVVPDASASLPVREALAAAEGRMPGVTFRRIREALLTLDQVSYAVAHGADVAKVAADAREVAREIVTP